MNQIYYIYDSMVNILFITTKIKITMKKCSTHYILPLSLSIYLFYHYVVGCFQRKPMLFNCLISSKLIKDSCPFLNPLSSAQTRVTNLLRDDHWLGWTLQLPKVSLYSCRAGKFSWKEGAGPVSYFFHYIICIRLYVRVSEWVSEGMSVRKKAKNGNQIANKYILAKAHPIKVDTIKLFGLFFTEFFGPFFPVLTLL